MFIETQATRPMIDRAYLFEQLPDALRLMEVGGHFGKIVVAR